MLLVMAVSLSLLGLMIEASKFNFILRDDVLSIGISTDAKLASQSCLEYALVRLGEDPDFEVMNGESKIDMVDGVEKVRVPEGHPYCIIRGVFRSDPSNPYSERQIMTSGYAGERNVSLSASISLSDQGIFILKLTFL